MMVPAHGKTIGEQAAQVLRTGVLPGQEPEADDPAAEAAPVEAEATPEAEDEEGAEPPPPTEIYPFATVTTREQRPARAANRGPSMSKNRKKRRETKRRGKRRP
jgi:hypothetical protein